MQECPIGWKDMRWFVVGLLWLGIPVSYANSDSEIKTMASFSEDALGLALGMLPFFDDLHTEERSNVIYPSQVTVDLDNDRVCSVVLRFDKAVDLEAIAYVIDKKHKKWRFRSSKSIMIWRISPKQISITLDKDKYGQPKITYMKYGSIVADTSGGGFNLKCELPR